MTAIKRFTKDQSGATAIIFGLSVLPIVGLFGGAVDYSRAASVQSAMQRAADASVLALVKAPATATQSDLNTQGQAVFNAAFKSAAYVSAAPVSVTRTGKTFTVTASATITNAFMQVFGLRQTSVTADSSATAGTQRIELALVLDNTGSMNDQISGQRKIDALKSQAKKLLQSLRNAATDSNTVKVSIVPFDTEVRLDANTYRYQPWFRWNPATETKDKSNWTGYVFDRYGSYATSDDAPTLSVINSLYPPQMVSDYPTSLAKVQKLTSLYAASDYASLTSLVDTMQPRGNTNIALGMIWGLATMSASEPFTEASPTSDTQVKRFVVLLTDGDNTASHINGQPNSNTTKIDQNTSAACTAVKNASIELFTIRLLDGNASLLRNCATDASHYSDVQSATDLSNTFSKITDAILSTRLTQ